MRVMLSGDVYADRGKSWVDRGTWPASWIAPAAGAVELPIACAYRHRFSLGAAATVRVHVSADERYRLFLDGQPIGRGPERGDAENWFFETYDLDLAAGEHVLVAQVWSLGQDAPAPYAQMSVRHAFLLSAEGEAESLLSTGVAGWECKRLGGYVWRSASHGWGTGAKTGIRAAEFSWGFERGEGEGWAPAVAVRRAVTGSVANEQPPVWQLRPAMLPPMLEEELRAGVARHVQAVESDALVDVAVRSSDHLASEAGGWTAMLAGRSAVTVPAGTTRRVIVDLGDYYCAYLGVVASGGAGASLRVQWAEALYEHVKEGRKGNRDEIEGKFFRGMGDRFELDGGRSRRFESVWWHAGRYLEIYVATAAEPLAVEGLTLRQTHYPFEFTGRFDCGDRRLTEVVPLMTRALEMCSHETYMDCPYYEQLMYVGDTRLEALATYALAVDDRLPRKAVLMFDASRRNGGLTQSRYPSRVCQIIPPFSLWWVGMVHDWAMWRNDPAFLSARMPGVRAVLNAWERWARPRGLVENVPSWAYMDWVPAWKRGIPPGGEGGVSGVINLQYAHVLGLAAELEDIAGEPELAARCRRLAGRTAAACRAVFFDTKRGLFADDVEHRCYSEHSQCLAILGGAADAGELPRIERGLFGDPDLERTTIYFTHYYFEACRLLGRMDKFHERMGLWFNLRAAGFRTTVECPEPSRSDCHAWGAHPAFHYLATILGIRPASPGFATVRVEPRLGPLGWARGSMPHPLGAISADLRGEGGRVAGAIELPEGLTGTFVANGASVPLRPGRQEVGA